MENKNNIENVKEEAQKFIQKLVQKYEGGGYIFRGVNKKHGTKTKTNCTETKKNAAETEKNAAETEKLIKRRVSSKFFQSLMVSQEIIDMIQDSIPYLEKTKTVDSARKRFYKDNTLVADILTDLRHYDGEVNVIDFTSDLNVALFFACNGRFDEDAEFFAIESGKLEEWDNDLYEKITRSPESDMDNPQEVTLKDFAKSENRSFIIQPGRTEFSKHRVDIQHSVFVYPTHGYIAIKEEKLMSSGNQIGHIEPIEKCLKKEILKYLKNLHDVHHETIYNDLLGFIANQENYENAQLEIYRGLSRYSEGNFEASIDAISRAIELNPQSAGAYHFRGLAKSNLSDKLRNSKEVLEEAIEVLEEAIEDLTQAIELNPQFTNAYYSRGLVKGKAGRYEEAIADFTEVINLNPQFVDAYYHRGIAAAEIEKYQEAEPDFIQAFELEPILKGVFRNHPKFGGWLEEMPNLQPLF